MSILRPIPLCVCVCSQVCGDSGSLLGSLLQQPTRALLGITPPWRTLPFDPLLNQRRYLHRWSISGTTPTLEECLDFVDSLFSPASAVENSGAALKACATSLPPSADAPPPQVSRLVLASQCSNTASSSTLGITHCAQGQPSCVPEPSTGLLVPSCLASTEGVLSCTLRRPFASGSRPVLASKQLVWLPRSPRPACPSKEALLARCMFF